MNIMINYDFWNAVRNVNEKMSPLKIIRNNKTKWIKKNLPLYTLVDVIFLRDLSSVPKYLGLQFFLCLSIEMITDYGLYEDKYRDISQYELNQLAAKFNEMDINTNYDLLTNSELYDKQYSVKLNEKKIPSLIESKYILVPYYDYKGEVSNVSIEQEHVVGSKEYVLSLGRPNKVLKPAFSSI